MNGYKYKKKTSLLQAEWDPSRKETKKLNDIGIILVHHPGHHVDVIDNC